MSDPKRRCPIILAMPTRNSEIKLDVEKLASDLAGIAVVYTGDDNVYRELNNLMPDEYQCHAGYVRIYQTKLDPQTPRDFIRHRYFSRGKIDELTPERVHRVIVASLARSELSLHQNVLTSLEDVSARRRERRLQELRESGESTEELVDLLEEDNSALTATVRELQLQIQGLEQQIGDEIDKNEDLSAQIEHLNGRVRYTQSELDTLYEQNTTLRSVKEQLELLEELPTSLSEAIDLIEKLWPDRIVFTERAHKSATDTGFSDTRIAWRCFWSMATKLHSLHFAPHNQGVDIEREFQNLSGFELATNEGKMTRKDSRLMNLRKDVYKGKEIDITPHVKYGSKSPNIFRVHYYADNDDRVIIVGHCGDHLENRSSRNR